jgi:asparagine synthase (glutamine-hydrolysing)
MCGIAGSWSATARQSEGELRRLGDTMASAIAHRGPDGQGLWTDAAAGLVLAHRRLAIIDLTPTGEQPMRSHSGRYVIVFNGEIYNHPDLRAELDRAGLAPAWRGTSDTETLLAAIDAWGLEGALGRSVGMFAAALWDSRERALSLFRDRMGEKPLYYGVQNGTLLFASELKSIVAHPSFTTRINHDAVQSLVRSLCVQGTLSIWEGVHKLPPGTSLTLRNPGAADAPVRYWSLAEVAAAGVAQPLDCSRAEAIDLLEDRLRRSVADQMLADVPLGALLSGGIDSSLIVSLMQQQAAQPVRTFSIGFEDAQFDESAHAKAVARHLGTDHTELIVTPGDVLDQIPALPRIYDEPFADSSQLPTSLLMAMTRRSVTVALSGDGGDEVFGGYNRYWMAPKIWSRIAWCPPGMRRPLGAALTSVPARRWDRLLGPAAGFLKQTHLGRKIHRIGHRLGESGDFQDFYWSLTAEWQPRERSPLLRGMGRPAAGEGIDWSSFPHPSLGMMVADSVGYLPDDVLVKVDRAAMSASLETRAPFLDHRVVELAWRLPFPLRIAGDGGKIALKEILNRTVPRELTDRPKMGFAVPLDDWLRGPLKDWAAALLDPKRLAEQGIFDPLVVGDTWRAHLVEGQSFSPKLWPILMFQAWMDEQASRGARAQAA